jgi:hypothetical protein
MWAFVGLAALVDLLIILAGWYLVFYDWQTVQESEVLTGAEPVNISLNDMRDVVRHMITLNDENQSLSLPAASEEKAIGFALHKHSVNHTETRKNHEKGHVVSERSKDYSGLINDIKNGERDYRTLAARHRVNLRTIKQYMQRYSKEVQPSTREHELH